MSFELTFRDLLLLNPDAVTEKKRFTGLMRDLFPGQQMQINLICMAWDLGIVSDIQATQHINNSFAFRYVKRLVDEYGVSRLNADWAISIWCVCYGQYVLQKRCDIKISKAKAGEAPAIKEERRPDAGTQYGDLFRYTSVDDGYGVTGFAGQNKRTIIFSNRYNNRPVKRIMAKSFAECEVQEVVMTDGIAIIEADAFKGCGDLKQVIFAPSVKEIGDGAFAGCKSLSMATLPPAIEQIGRFAFSGTGIKTLNIPSTVYWTGEGVYSNCVRLEKVSIPDNIISIPDRMFKDCTGLKAVNLPDCVDQIGEEAFSGCIGLDSIVIPDSVKAIGKDAFAGIGPKFRILCTRLSVAEQYARDNGLLFQIIY